MAFKWRRLKRHNQIFKIIITLTIGWLGSLIFSIFNIPLSWLIGSMIFTILATIAGIVPSVPKWSRKSGLTVIGITMGLYFTPSMGNLIVNHLGLMIVISVVTIGFGLINSCLYKKISKIDWVTSIFGSVPGGLSQMVIVGKELGGNAQIIAIQQSLRVIIVVLTIPFVSSFLHTNSVSETTVVTPIIPGFINISVLYLLLVGITGNMLATRFHFPAPYVIGPLAIVSLITLSGFSLGYMPQFFVHIAQLLIGISIGAEFKKSEMEHYKKYILFGIISGISLTVLSFAVAYLLILISGIDFQTAILSTAPGGLAEMSITALAVGANIPLVTAFQVCRMLVSVICVPKIIQFIIKKNQHVEDKKSMTCNDSQG